MAVPFDTLKLARRFEAAGIDTKQAGDMAEAIAEATASANLATKRDLEEMELRLTNRIDRMVGRLGALVVIVAGLLFTALHYIPPSHG